MKEKFNSIFIKETNNAILQFIRYFFVGGFAAFINILCLFIFKELFHVYYLISNIIGFITGLITNYILSKKLVFAKEKTSNHIFEFVSYAVIGIIGLIIDTILMWIFTDVFTIYYLISKIISTAIVFIWNFVARKILYILINVRRK